MSYIWVKTYLLMGHNGLIYIGKSIRFIYFFNTPQIYIEDVSNEYRYRIHIKYPILWVKVSVFSFS
jgi:hypothetical protein